MRFNNPYFMTRKLLPTALFKCSLVLCLFFAQVQVWGQDGKLTFDKSIIESAILVNLNSIKVGNGSSANRRLSSQYSPIDANSSNLIQNEILSSVGPTAVSPTFVGSLTSILDSMPPGTLADGLDHTLDYLAANKISFGLNDDSLFKAIKSAYAAYLQSVINSGQDIIAAVKEAPARSLPNLIPDRILLWDQTAPKWAKLLSRALVEAINESAYGGDKDALIGTASHSTISNVLKLINESTTPASGFYPGIEPIDSNRETSNLTMKFDGSLQKFKNFDPAKSRILEFAAKGLADGIFLSAPLTKANVPSYSKQLGENSIAAAIEFLSALNGDNSQFAFEVSKSISSGLSLGSVYATTSQPGYIVDNLPAIAAEEMAKAVSSEAIRQSLVLGNGYSLTRLAESTAFGSSMGAQLASVNDKAWDYEENWESFSRQLLAQASSTGSSKGSLDASIGYTATQADVDAGRATAVDEFVMLIENDPDVADTLFKTNRQEVLGVANGSASGSLLGNTAFAIYYPTLLQPIINYSSQGTNKGGILAKNLAKVDKPKGVTEQFEIEIARALAHGASMGAVFQVVGLLKDSTPDKRTYDFDTIAAVESVTYGSTFGAITGGIEAGEDSVIIKQAIKQGANEGSLAGAALGVGVSETVADTLTLKSQASILAAVRNANDKAAKDANSNMAVKAVQASSNDILQLMKLYNITPRFTNPSGIFSDPNRQTQDEQLFKDRFPVASPI